MKIINAVTDDYHRGNGNKILVFLMNNGKNFNNYENDRSSFSET